MGTFSVSGSCNAAFSTNPATPTAPDSCGGMTIVAWTVTADHCYTSTTHVDTFTVVDATSISVTEASSVEENSCQTQDQINTAFASWLGTFSVSGGCNAAFSTNPATPAAPDSCGGMTIVTWTVSADHCYNSTTHVDTFIVTDATTVSVTEAGTTEENSCQTQIAINSAFASWLGTFSVSGGCNAAFSTNPASPVAPDSCGGMTIVTWTVTADHCYNSTTHVDTFTVTDATTVSVTEAGTVEENSCQTQDQINTAFATWLGTFSVSGGCNAAFSTNPATPVAPDSCGGMTIVTWTVTADHCYNSTTHVDTFTVVDATTVSVTEAGKVEENSCQTQDQINTAFASWLGTFSVSGGCNATFSTNPATPAAPDSCGGMTIVTWTVSANHCYSSTTHVDTFTVLSATTVSVTEAGKVEENSCQTQSAIDAAFTSWLGSFSISGGCNPAFTISPVTPVAPDSCGGMTIVTWTVTDDHCYDPSTHIDTFSVLADPAIFVLEAGTVVEASCQSQAQIDAAFSDWLSSFFLIGGCTTILTTSPSTPMPPDSCGGMTIVTWTLINGCNGETNYIDTFTVLDFPDVVVTEAGTVEQASCQSQDDIDAAFASWLGTFSISGGCSATFSTNPATPTVPDSCGGMTIVTWTVSSEHCYTPTTHIDTFTVLTAPEIIVFEAGSIEQAACQTQAQIDAAFLNWGSEFFASGGCSLNITIDPEIPTAPDSCGGMTIVTWTVSAEDCYITTTHVDTFTVLDALDIEWSGNLLEDFTVPTTSNSCDTLLTFDIGEALDGCNQDNIEYQVTAIDSSGSALTISHTTDLSYEALFPGGLNEVYILASGSCGSILRDTFFIEVIDEINPTSICAGDTIEVEIGIDQTGTLLENALVAGNSTDNCGFTEFSPEMTYTCEDLGINMVDLIATDSNNNKDTIQCPVEVIGGTNCPVNLTPNFFPPQAAIFDIGDVKDFVIKVDNTLFGTTQGIIQVFIPYQVGYTLEFLDNATTASTLLGPWPIENTSWTKTLIGAGILLTAKNNVEIGAFGSLNFAIQVTADNGGSSGSITANISPTSGGQIDNTDDTKSRNINVNN